jgi:hypothetical protein
MGGICQCPIKTQGAKPTLYSAEAALKRILTVRNFLSVINPYFIRYNK